MGLCLKFCAIELSCVSDKKATNSSSGKRTVGPEPPPVSTTALNCPSGFRVAQRGPDHRLQYVTPPSPQDSWDEMQLRPSSHAHVTLRQIIETSIHQFGDCDSGLTKQRRRRTCVAMVCSDSHHVRDEDILVTRAVVNEAAGHVTKGDLGDGWRWNPFNSNLPSKESLQVFKDLVWYRFFRFSRAWTDVELNHTCTKEGTLLF